MGNFVRWTAIIGSLVLLAVTLWPEEKVVPPPEAKSQVSAESAVRNFESEMRARKAESTGPPAEFLARRDALSRQAGGPSAVEVVGPEDIKVEFTGLTGEQCREKAARLLAKQRASLVVNGVPATRDAPGAACRESDNTLVSRR